MSDPKNIASIYNEFGAYYHDSRKKSSGRLHNEFIDIPTTLSLLPKDLQGITILDAGCGSGIYANLLAGKGAKVTGLDISDKMIEIARRETPPEFNIAYHVGSLDALPFTAASFDIIICTYVLENVEDISQVFRQFYSVLKPKGTCIFSVSHPLRANSQKMVQDGQEVWIVENYFETGVRESDFGGGMFVPKYKRTIQNYVDALASANFVIDKLLEPQPAPAGKEVDQQGYAKAMRLPQVLTMRLTK